MDQNDGKLLHGEKGSRIMPVWGAISRSSASTGLLSRICVVQRAVLRSLHPKSHLTSSLPRPSLSLSLMLSIKHVCLSHTLTHPSQTRDHKCSHHTRRLQTAVSCLVALLCQHRLERHGLAVGVQDLTRRNLPWAGFI